MNRTKTMLFRCTLAVATVWAMLAGSVLAQQTAPSTGGSMPSMPMHQAPGKTGAAPATDGGSSSRAFKAANEQMMNGMKTPLSGDADRDFVAGMIPHHQGAIDMARVELKYGQDPKLKKLAQNIIAAQHKEIKFMNGWLAQHPK